MSSVDKTRQFSSRKLDRSSCFKLVKSFGNVLIHLDKAFRSINIPKLVKAKRLRERRQLLVTDAIQELRVMIEIAVFTEHLLYNMYCEKYSPKKEICVDGVLELNKYMKVIVKGVSTNGIWKIAT